MQQPVPSTALTRPRSAPRPRPGRWSLTHQEISCRPCTLSDRPNVFEGQGAPVNEPLVVLIVKWPAGSMQASLDVELAAAVVMEPPPASQGVHGSRFQPTAYCGVVRECRSACNTHGGGQQGAGQNL